MVLVLIEAGSSMPVYEQVRGQIAAKIADESLPAGTKLPTIRQLAAELGLAVNTVAHAYRELEAAGLVQTRPRHGTTVAGGGSNKAGASGRERLRAGAREYAELARRLGVSKEDAVEAVRQEVS